ncbi:hyaluronidase-1 [Crotalus adamanteus]|uniref:Hyaluronidase n=1 Tax=Crotalus adamanteus TaxID=8729 RepID=A0AAW1BWC8_CROAD
MEQTLALSETLRPKGFWGFYGFPNCYNDEYQSVNYTGECPEIEKQRNNELYWLWKQSRALYPSIYLPNILRLTHKTLEYVRHRIEEAFRVLKWTQNDIPVLPYTTTVYDFTHNFITQEDLVHTIGESASQGAAGVILWGSTNFSKSREACLEVKEYVDKLLGPYIMNVTSSARLCSEILCSKNGRCVRQQNHPEAFLHLSSASFTIKKHKENRNGSRFAEVCERGLRQSLEKETSKPLDGSVASGRKERNFSSLAPFRRGGTVGELRRLRRRSAQAAVPVVASTMSAPNFLSLACKVSSR